jgi:uncharacterized membrane protein
MSWRTGFLISLAVNILIIGALAGFVLGGGLNQVRLAGAIALGEPRAVAAALPADVRAALRRDLVRAWFDTDAERGAWRTANADVMRQLEAEPYDVEAMKGALQRQRETGAAAIAKFHNKLAEALADLTPAQRAAAAEALAHARTRLQRSDDAELGASGENLAPEGEETRRERMRERVQERLRRRRN